MPLALAQPGVLRLPAHRLAASHYSSHGILAQTDHTTSTTIMGKLILAPPRGDTRSRLWTKSIAGTFFGLMWGLLNAGIIVNLLTPHVLAIPCAITAGGCIAGAFQGISLRIYTRPALLWITLSIAGWWLACGGVWLIFSIPGPPPEPARVFILIGILASLTQLLMLRRYIDRSWSWVIINIGCWLFMSLLIEQLSIDFYWIV